MYNVRHSKMMDQLPFLKQAKPCCTRLSKQSHLSQGRTAIHTTYKHDSDQFLSTPSYARNHNCKPSDRLDPVKHDTSLHFYYKIHPHCKQSNLPFYSQEEPNLHMHTQKSRARSFSHLHNCKPSDEIMMQNYTITCAVKATIIIQIVTEVHLPVCTGCFLNTRESRFGSQ